MNENIADNKTSGDNLADNGKQYAFFQHKECEFFPCHNTTDTENFNCLFCFCPLYLMGADCGGNFTYTKNGIKDCTGCLVPHKRENYDIIVAKLTQKNMERT